MSYISQNKNYTFSLFNKDELEDYLNFLSSYLIEYRNTINLNNSISFGMEFEYEDINQEIVDEFITNNMNTYKSVNEKEFEIGGEIISRPLYDNEDTWREIKIICDYLKKINGVVNRNAGSHIHIGVSSLKNIEHFKQFIILYYILLMNI